MVWNRSVARCRVTLLALTLFCRAATAPAAEAAIGPLTIVPPGTPVGDVAAPRWNKLLLASVPRIAAGDTASISNAIRERLGLCTLVLLATVRPVAGPNGDPWHRLEEVGVGYAVPLAGKLEVIDTENPPAAANVDFIGRQILSQNGRALVGLHCVGATDTVQVFDAESILCRHGRHGDFLMRHFVWVDPVSGECSMCVWLLVKRPDGGLAVVDEPVRWLPDGSREDRAIHVDGNEFLLGIPTKRAFALIDMPPGLPLEWSPALRAMAAQSPLQPAAVQALAVELNRCLEPLRSRQQALP